MHGFLGVYEIPHIASIVLSIFTIIVITNSFNLIDGVDGLAGSLGLLTTFVFGIYFFYAGQLTYAVMAFALAGSTIFIMIWNFNNPTGGSFDLCLWEPPVPPNDNCANATPLTVGRIPRLRLAPALPSERKLFSGLLTSPITARHSDSIFLISPERNRTVA